MCSRFTPEKQLALKFFFFYWLGYYILVLWYIKEYLVNVWCQNACITEAFTKLSWTSDKFGENDLNLIEKYVCAAYDPHNCFHANNVNRMWFLLFTKSSDNKLRNLTREALQLHILCSVYTAGWIWGTLLQPNDQIPSPVDWR